MSYQNPPAEKPAVALVLKGYPRLSETFIAQEIRALEKRGLDIRLKSLRHPTDKAVHPVIGEIRAPVSYLPEYLYQEPLRVLRAWWHVRKRKGYGAARTAWLRDLRRDPTPNRGRRFGQALVLAHELEPDVGRLYAHFLHTPASVTRYASLITGLPWSCSAHAKDIWTSPDWEKAEKLAEMEWLATCTRANRDHLSALSPRPDVVDLVYHGLDLSRFPAPSEKRPGSDGAAEAAPVVLLSVGRAVAKKGYDDLLDALAALPIALNWRLVHIGGGPLLANLKAQGERLGIAERIDWRGPRPQAEVLAAYQEADLFVLASRIARDGDRDGLPNVLMEAQSQRLPCVSTAVSAIPEFITNGENGLLVAPADPAALKAALARLITDPDLRARMGEAGLERLREDFSQERWIDPLAEKFGLPSGPIDTPAPMNTGNIAPGRAARGD